MRTIDIKTEVTPCVSKVVDGDTIGDYYPDEFVCKLLIGDRCGRAIGFDFKCYTPEDAVETHFSLLKGIIDDCLEQISRIKAETYFEEYVERMRKCESYDTECAHIEADKILCELVEKYVPNGAEIVKEFNKLYKWYA